MSKVFQRQGIMTNRLFHSHQCKSNWKKWKILIKARKKGYRKFIRSYELQMQMTSKMRGRQVLHNRQKVKEPKDEEK